MKTIMLKGIKALLQEGGRESLRDADLVIEGNRIKQVGKDLPVPPDTQVIDCRHDVAIPGLVNTHHHFYQTLTRALPSVQNAKLFDWLTSLYEVWKGIDTDAVTTSSLLAMSELVRTGCTTTTDHHYLYPKGFDGDIMALQFQAADQIGMRFSPTRGSMSLSKKDGGLPPDSVVQTEEEILSDSERCIRSFHDPSPLSMHRIVLAPCSPFSVTKECMEESARLARSYGVRLHTHLCETKDEEETCMRMYGVRPLALMEECGLFGPDVFYAHGIHFNDEELRALAKAGCSIAHCPSSNMRLGSGICRVREMLDLGINVGIGVDGSASNDSSDMLGELRMAMLLQRVRYGASALTVGEVMRMGTENGAAMLGYTKVGRLYPGWAADIALFNVDDIAYAGAQADPVASLVFCGDSHIADMTIINGKIVVRKGKVLGVDEEELARHANEVAEQLLCKTY